MADPKAAASAAAGKKTLVEEGTEFRGSLTSKCPVVVSGKVDGEIAAPSLTVSPSGAVHGKVKVAEILSEGEVSGEIEADSIQLSGRVSNNTVIRTKSLEVKLTSAKDSKLQVSFGECMLEVGEEPRKGGSGGPPPSAPPKPGPPQVK